MGLRYQCSKLHFFNALLLESDELANISESAPIPVTLDKEFNFTDS